MAIFYQKNAKTGVTYVGERYSYWDEEKQKNCIKTKMLGKLDPETGEIVPTRKYTKKKDGESKQGGAGHASKEKPRKVGRPRKSTQTQAMAASGNKRGRPKGSGKLRTDFKGASNLLQAIAECSGLKEDILEAFPKFGDRILFLAYFLVINQNSNMRDFRNWFENICHKERDPLIDEEHLRLVFDSMDETSVQKFFELRMGRSWRKRYFLANGFTIANYKKLVDPEDLADYEEPVPQPTFPFNMVFDSESGTPCMMVPHNQDIDDFQAVFDQMRGLASEIDGETCLCVSSSLSSHENIDALLESGVDFMIAQRMYSPIAKAAVDDTTRLMLYTKLGLQRDKGIVHAGNEFQWSELGGIGRAKDAKVDVTLFLDQEIRQMGLYTLDNILINCEHNIRTGYSAIANIEKYERYFDVSGEDDDLQVTRRDADIYELAKDYGFKVYLSRTEDDPEKFHKAYNSCAMFEEMLANFQIRFAMFEDDDRDYIRDLAGIYDESNLRAKAFVQFVAFILYSDFQARFQSANFDEYDDPLHLLEELEDMASSRYYYGRSSHDDSAAKIFNIYSDLGVSFAATSKFLR